MQLKRMTAKIRRLDTQLEDQMRSLAVSHSLLEGDQSSNALGVWDVETELDLTDCDRLTDVDSEGDQSPSESYSAERVAQIIDKSQQVIDKCESTIVHAQTTQDEIEDRRQNCQDLLEKELLLKNYLVNEVNTEKISHLFREAERLEQKRRQIAKAKAKAAAQPRWK